MVDPRREPGNSHMSADFLKLLDRWRTIARVTLSVTAVIAVIAALYFLWWQASMRTVVLGFRPTFAGAAGGMYPNGLPFGPSDITASSVIDQVFDANNVEKHCSRDAFKAAFVVEQHSPSYQLLDAEYVARLSDTRLTAVDRERIQAEYQSRRVALPLAYQLVFAPGETCRSLPLSLATKSLYDVLAVWAAQSEERRGVLDLQVQILSPNVLDVGLRDEGARLIRADLIRTALRRLISNVRDVERRPGASLVRLGESRVTFAELRAKFEDLIQSRLEPLVVIAGRGLGAESISWVDEALASANQERVVAEGKADVYLRGLREYSGSPQAADAPPAQPQPRSSDVQSLTPQIDRTFIDRILEMSEANTAFRQELTRDMVEAGAEAVESRAKAGYYEHLADALRRPSPAGLPSAEIDTRLDAIVNDAKLLAQQFVDLYSEWSRVALRPSAGLYQLDSPVRTTVSRPFRMTGLLLTVIGAFILTLLGTVVAYLGRWHLDRLRANRAL